MQIDIRESESKATVTLTGRLDIHGADVVALPLATLAHSKTRLFVDMAGVIFIAAIGMEPLVSAARCIGRRGGRLVLLNLNPAVSEIVEKSRMRGLVYSVAGVPDARPISSHERRSA